jgi:4-hydroxy-tetrahydrodipicolinate reductase
MKIAIAGAAGRMGQMLIRQIAHTEGCSLAGAIEGASSNALGRDAGEVAGVGAKSVKIVSDAAAAIGAANVVIDFTVPAATVAHAGIAADKGVAMVIGTTGLNPEQTAAIHDAAKKVPIMWAANMALGVNILLALVEKTASMLDPAYDIEVLEMHHRHKIDAPSGTALALGREVGVHTVMFAAAGERLEISHRAFSRETYAAGAIRAAQWLSGKKPGLYGMKDVLGL